MSQTKGRTYHAVAGLRASDPTMPAAEMARRLGVSRERVRQILGKLGLPANFWPQPALCFCGKERPHYPSNSHRKPYCSDECKERAATERKGKLYVTLVCNWCGSPCPPLLRTYIEWKRRRGQRLFFCDRRCLGSWRGATHGFGAHPENAGGPRKACCKRGHPLAEARVTVRENGYIHRQCRVCVRERQRGYYQAKPALTSKP